jgi:hypothetical protein
MSGTGWSDPLTDKKSIIGKWIVRVGDRKGRKLQIIQFSDACYVASDRHNSFTVPRADYDFCDPPREDVTDQLCINGGYVIVKDKGDHIAKLCCNGNYTVSFNPFKVERIS